MPSQLRAYQLLKLGVSLTEQGLTYGGEASAVDLDWLLAIEDAVCDVAGEVIPNG